MMDTEKFLEIANYMSKMDMFPYFELSHCLLTCLYLKDEIGPEEESGCIDSLVFIFLSVFLIFPFVASILRKTKPSGAFIGLLYFTNNSAHQSCRKFPVAYYISAMICMYAGTLLSSFLLGEPILACFTKTNSLLLATGSWYFINYMPFDIGCKIVTFLPIKIALSVMKEILRCRKVLDGVSTAARIFPNGYIIMVLIGVIKGNGTAVLKILERLLRGVWTPTSFETINMSYPTKACFVASVIFILDAKTDIFQTPHTLIQLGVVICFIYFKLSSLLLGISDPFVPFENLLCWIFFGGVIDSLQPLLTPVTKGDQTSLKNATAAKKKE